MHVPRILFQGVISFDLDLVNLILLIKKHTFNAVVVVVVVSTPPHLVVGMLSFGVHNIHTDTNQIS